MIVVEYECFVVNIGYKIEVEKNCGCVYYLNGELVWEVMLNWCNLGFE